MAMIYFVPGEVVTLKQNENVHYVPNMIVKAIKKGYMRKDEELPEINGVKSKPKNELLGIICFWFTTNGSYEEKVFNTKDLIHVK